MRSNDSQKIIVVGIPKTLDDTQLSELFSDFGDVVEAKVALDAASNTSRGFGFVTFTATSAMRAAIKGMNQRVIEGRTLNVRQLVPKDEFQAQKKETPEASKRPCWLLRKGKCKEGASCPFSHDIHHGSFGKCFKFVQTGYCKHGDMCKFVHEQTAGDEDEDEDENNVSQLQSKKAIDTESKRVCYGFQNGRCHRGKKCFYTHEMLASDDARSAEKKKGVANSRKKRGRVEENEDEETTRMEMEKKKSRLAAPKMETFKQKGAPKKFEWKAKAQTSKKQESNRELDVEESQHRMAKAKKTRPEKIDMGAAFDGVSDDDAARPRYGGKKEKVDKERMRANREKALLERRAKREAKKTALFKLRTKGEVEIEA